jgi:class 3 adenylate cyclase
VAIELVQDENMDNELRRLLENAKGTTEHIIAIILDIRGFTPFCKEIGESLDIANFLKRIYIRIIDEYFPNASFYKPTGDGLLIVIPYSEESPKDTVASTMKNCLNLVQNFGKLCEGDEMIYFTTPDKVGIGMSRGTACCIASGKTVIDYSGKVLNLASRLNDFARPSGIVFDSSLGLSLLTEEMRAMFLCENVSARGIAEDKLMRVYFTKQYTIIPPSRKELIKEPEWSVLTFEPSLKELKDALATGAEWYSMELEKKPFDEKQITLYVRVIIDGQFRGTAIYVGTDNHTRYASKGLKHFVDIDLSSLVGDLVKGGAKDDAKVNIEVSCPIAHRTIK